MVFFSPPKSSESHQLQRELSALHTKALFRLTQVSLMRLDITHAKKSMHSTVHTFNLPRPRQILLILAA